MLECLHILARDRWEQWDLVCSCLFARVRHGFVCYEQWSCDHCKQLVNGCDLFYSAQQQVVWYGP